jgi:hypothetical protein
MRAALFASALAAFSSLSSVAFADATELTLPAYKATALANDAPVKDVLLDSHTGAWLLTANALWRWEFATKSLRRLNLQRSGGTDAGDASPLARLGTDGLSVFAASDATMYQVQWRDGRIYRYTAKAALGGRTLGFAGDGDDFWMLHSKVLMRFDRYGKTLAPKYKTPFLDGLESGDRIVFDPGKRALWFATGKSVYAVDFTGEAAAPRAVFTASHPLLGLSRAGSELLAHTASTVVRLGLDGRQHGAIPVEGRRKLVAVSLTPDAHAYLFSDRLLEVYEPRARTLSRHRLPLDDAKAVTRLRLVGDLVAVLESGRGRIFRLVEPGPR